MSKLAEPVLVGREHELEILQQNLDLAVQGKGTTFLFRAKQEAEKPDL